MYYTHIYWYRKPSLSCAGVSCVWADDCNKIVVACGLPGTHWDTDKTMRGICLMVPTYSLIISYHSHQ